MTERERLIAALLSDELLERGAEAACAEFHTLVPWEQISTKAYWRDNTRAAFRAAAGALAALPLPEPQPVKWPAAWGDPRMGCTAPPEPQEASGWREGVLAAIKFIRTREPGVRQVEGGDWEDWTAEEIADELERKLLRAPPAAATWTCAARRQGTAGGNDPADCDWPDCGCDLTAAEPHPTIERVHPRSEWASINAAHEREQASVDESIANLASRLKTSSTADPPTGPSARSRAGKAIGMIRSGYVVKPAYYLQNDIEVAIKEAERAAYRAGLTAARERIAGMDKSAGGFPAGYASAYRVGADITRNAALTEIDKLIHESGR